MAGAAGSAASWWTEVTPSQYDWERRALEFIRSRLPGHDPYRAWSNFEFVADDGSVYEVDLLVLTPKGFFLVEIKSRPGRIEGDAGVWSWTHEGRVREMDNPLILANRKAKKLKSLLMRQSEWPKGGQHPFLQPLIFCSAEKLEIALDEHARHGVCVRDREAEATAIPGGVVGPASAGAPGPSRTRTPEGIVRALKSIPPEQYNAPNRFKIDRKVATGISRAITQAGIRPSQRARQVGDYKLGRLLFEGPGYQDFEASHVSSPKTQRRGRIYTVARTGESTLRETIRRAARREFEILEGIQHPGILKVVQYTEHELGPTLFFEGSPEAMRLDLFLVRHVHQLGVDQRLDIVRQLAEALRYAHGKQLYHRALSPMSVLVTGPDPAKPKLQIFNWQTALREIATTSVSTGLYRTGTAHLQDLIEDGASVYLAPETMTALDIAGESLDVFSLGAITYHVFSGRPPASNPLELQTRLREGRGLQLPDAVDGATRSLQELVRLSTQGAVTDRLESVDEFLEFLERVEEELTTPDEGIVANPLEAKAGDLLPGGFKVMKRLGTGSTAVVFLVEGNPDPQVLKVSRNADQDPRLRDEAVVLAKLRSKARHSRIVSFEREVKVGDRVALVMDSAGEETLRQRLRTDGRLSVELLQRFGEDILDAVKHLEEHDVAHRDIKPDNLGIARVGRENTLHVILFDFSLSKTPATEIRAGTPGYLEPFLVERKPCRWDVHAEHYAVAVTLYEMATGVMPKWHDGKSNPATLDCEVTVESDLFDAELRDSLTKFFTKALRRDFRQRFHNIQEMQQAWRDLFTRVETRPGGGEGQDDEHPELDPLLQKATPETLLAALPFSARAGNALERCNANTVRDLLRIRPFTLRSLRGVGTKTRGELLHAIQVLAQRFPELVGAEPPPKEPETPEVEGALTVERILQRLLPTRLRNVETHEARTLRRLLGLDVAGVSDSATASWPSQNEIAASVGISQAQVSKNLKKTRTEWAKLPSLKPVRDGLAEALAALGGVATEADLTQAVLTACGSTESPPASVINARAVARGVVEAERSLAEPRWIVRRTGGRVFVVLDEPDGQAVADYVDRLGRAADQLAQDDPLPSPSMVEQKLRAVSVPAGFAPLPQERLVRLAAAASEKAAASSRLELYPRGMPAERALNLARGAIVGVKELTLADIRERVAARYPEAEGIPEGGALDDLLRKIDLDLKWDPEAAGGVGAYVMPTVDTMGISSRSSIIVRQQTVLDKPTFVTPEVVEARRFDERLEHAAREGAYLVLRVDPRRVETTVDELKRRFGVSVVSFEELLLRHLGDAASARGVEWTDVLDADAQPEGSLDARELVLMVSEVMPAIEAELLAREGTVLLLHTGPLARYDQMEALGRLRERISVRSGDSSVRLQGLWVLVAADEHQEMPVVEGKAVPVVTRAEWAAVPKPWLENRHRGGAADVAAPVARGEARP